MSVRHGLLALLARKSAHGYELRAGFEHDTGTTGLNVGQVYTTLRRLERDGLVVALPDDRGDRTEYRLTSAGSEVLHHWFATPLAPDAPARDELVVKIHLALTTPSIDPTLVIETQRNATMHTLQGLTAHKARLDADDLIELINVDYSIERAQSELSWLDTVQQRIKRRNSHPRTEYS